MSENDGVLGPRESGQFIAKNSDEITINEDGVSSVAEMIFERMKSGQFHFDFDTYDINVKSDSIQEKIDWIFFIDTINFSFWSDTFVVSYKGQSHSGYFAACACVNRAVDEGVPITDANFMKNVSEDELTKIFRSDLGTTIPMIKERLEVIHEAGNVLLNEFAGSFLNCLKICDGSAKKLLNIIASHFSSYRDYATFNGKRVSFLKRAQILVSDIYSCLHTKSPLCNFSDIGSLTMFADYRVPQVMSYLGVLSYSEKLLDMLYADVLFQNGSEAEVVLRGFSIYACDKITEVVQSLAKAHTKSTGKKFRKIFAGDVDMFLWTYRRSVAKEIEKANIPFHKTRCIYY